MTLSIADENRVRTLTLNRPEALNAFNEALYDAATVALGEAADDPDVSVVVLTGAGRAFSAGTDLAEMQARITDPGFTPGRYGFTGLLDAMTAFPKPFLCAVNGLGIGIGTTILGFADLSFMATTAPQKVSQMNMTRGISSAKSRPLLAKIRRNTLTPTRTSIPVIMTTMMISSS